MTGLRLFTGRVSDAVGQPLLDADGGEELMHVQPGVSVVLGDLPPESPGTLYITTKQVVWLNDTDRQKGYAVDFLSISLHAVCRDPEAYSSPCIYTQIDTGLDGDESEESDSDGIRETDISKITEMRLVPADPNQLDSLFEFFCQGAELNPEPLEEEEEEEHNWIFSADQMQHEILGNEESQWFPMQNPANSVHCSNGDHELAHNVLQLQINDQRFEDAEEMDSEDKNGQ